MARSKVQEDPRKATPKGKPAPEAEVEEVVEEEEAPRPARPAKGGKAARARADFARVPGSLKQACLTALTEALSALLKVELTADDVVLWQGAGDAVPLAQEEDALAVPVTMREGAIEAEGLFLVSRSLGNAIVNLMIGEDAESPPPSFDDLHRSVLAEAVGGVATALQDALVETTGLDLYLTADSSVEDDASRLGSGGVLCASVALTAEAGFDGALALVMPEAATLTVASRPMGKGMAAVASLPATHFPQLRTPTAASVGQNLGILLDVPMQMVAVLGRRGVKLRDLLQMGPGSIMELDKLAGEPLELLVNGKLIGYGEVIVLDEKFGIKVRDVVNPEDRLRSANL